MPESAVWSHPPSLISGSTGAPWFYSSFFTALVWVCFGVSCAKSANSSISLEIPQFLQLENHSSQFWEEL